MLTLKGKHGTGHKGVCLDHIKLTTVKERQSYSSEAIARTANKTVNHHFVERIGEKNNFLGNGAGHLEPSIIFK